MKTKMMVTDISIYALREDDNKTTIHVRNITMAHSNIQLGHHRWQTRPYY